MEKENCSKKVWDHWKYRNCSRFAIKDGFCKQHHPDSVKERERKTEERYKREQRNSPWTMLANAKKEIEDLKDEIDRLKQQLDN